MSMFRFLGEPFVSRWMGRPLGTPKQAGVSYANRVLGTSPLAYWPLWEVSGAVANDISGNGYHGSYTGVTLGQAGIGDGRTCPYFEGANDYVDIFSAGYQAAVNMQVFTASIWCKVYPGAWTDGIQRQAMIQAVDLTDNAFRLRKHSGNNTVTTYYEANNVPLFTAVAGLTTLDFFNLLVTVDLNAGVDGEYKTYINSVQQGATQTTLGTWAGNIVETYTNIGSLDEIPANVWHGWLAHAAWWNRVLTTAEIAEVSVL